MERSKEECKKLVEFALGRMSECDESQINYNSVRGCLKGLTENQRVAYENYVLNGMTYVEVGKLLGVSHSRARELCMTVARKLWWIYQHPKFEQDAITIDSELYALGLPSHLYNALRRAGLGTIRDVIELTEDDLVSIRNLGKKGRDKLNSTLNTYGLSLKKSDKIDEKDFIVHPSFGTEILQDSLNAVYAKCKSRTEKYGFESACKGCPFKGTNGAQCMFKHQPRIWDVEEVTIKS